MSKSPKIVQQPDGRWMAVVHTRHLLTKKPLTYRRKNFLTKEEAKKGYKNLIKTIEQRMFQERELTWDGVIPEFLEHLKEQPFTQTTIHNYTAKAKSYGTEVWGNKPLNKITGSMIRDHIQNRDCTVATKKAMLKVIRAVFEYCLEKGYISNNPVPKMHFREGIKIKQVLTEPQVEYFLNMARELNSPWYPHWVLAIYTGMRNGELYALQWDQIDFDNKIIYVTRSWTNKNGFVNLTKSGNDRVTPINEDLLLPFLKQRKLSSDENFVLPRTYKWDDGRQAEELRKFLVGIDLPSMRFHDLRATWATLLLSKGEPPARVMTMGGWSDIKTMMIYIRKAGIDVKGGTNSIQVHSISKPAGQIVNLSQRL